MDCLSRQGLINRIIQVDMIFTITIPMVYHRKQVTQQPILIVGLLTSIIIIVMGYLKKLVILNRVAIQTVRIFITTIVMDFRRKLVRYSKTLMGVMTFTKTILTVYHKKTGEVKENSFGGYDIYKINQYGLPQKTTTISPKTW